MLGSGALADLRRVAQERLLQEKAARAAAERLKSPPEDGEVHCLHFSVQEHTLAVVQSVSS